jgi:hypothetical protein
MSVVASKYKILINSFIMIGSVVRKFLNLESNMTQLREHATNQFYVTIFPSQSLRRWSQESLYKQQWFDKELAIAKRKCAQLTNLDST